MYDTILALRSIAPVIYASAAMVALVLVFQLFGIDLAARLTLLAEKFTIRDKIGNTGA